MLTSVFVIKRFSTGEYLSVSDRWDEWNMSREFDTKQEASEHIIREGISDMCVIEEVYRP